MPRLLPPGLLALLLSTLPTAPTAGATPALPFVERVEPPVLVRGQTARITAVGRHLERHEGLWTSLPAGAVQVRPVEAGADSGRAAFDVTVGDRAPVGVFGLRVSTASGLSNLVLALIDDLPARPLPDGPRKAPVPVALPGVVWGRFREAEVDRYAVEVKPGQSVSFEAVGNRLGKEVDPVVTVRDGRGRVVAECDNSPGLYFDCRFEHTFAAAGTYTVEVHDVRYQGHPHGLYALRLGRFPAARVAVPAALQPGRPTRLFLPEVGWPTEVTLPADHPEGPVSLELKRPGDDAAAWAPVEVSKFEAFRAGPGAGAPATATSATVPAQLSGVLRMPGERHRFRLDLSRGQSIHAVGQARVHASPVDVTLSLLDDIGREVARGNAVPGSDDQVRLSFTAPRAASYHLAVGDLLRTASDASSYRVEVRDGPAPPAVAAEVEGLTVPRGGYQCVPLVLNRDGLAGPVGLSLVGAPPGVTLTPTEIPEGVNTLVCRLAAGPTAPLGLHTFQVLARSARDPHAPAGLVRTRPLIDRQLLNVDLIPYALREDQTRLPAGVAERFALQVTPPSPFAVELVRTKVTLPRYQHAPVPLVTTREPGFTAPITFSARGGQLADKAEGRTRVYAEFPEATVRDPAVSGAIHSRILTNLGVTRIEVLASAVHEGRTVALLRSFDLEARTAFAFTSPPEPAKVLPGGVARVKLTVERLPSFGGAVTVNLTPLPGLSFPENLTLPAGKESVDVEVRVAPEAQPGRRSVNLLATGDVDGFEEEARGRLEVEVTRPEVPKKR